MAKINLLPWREQRRKERKQEFYVLLGASAGLSILLFFAFSWQVGEAIQYQQQRNQLLQTEITQLDRQIEKIEELERTRARMLQRKQIIEELQLSRSQMVHMFDQLVRTIPEGVRLTKITQQEKLLTLEGIATSNAKVSAYLRSLERSPWFAKSDLQLTEAMEEASGAFSFALQVSLTTGKDEDEAVEDELVAGGGSL